MDTQTMYYYNAWMETNRDASRYLKERDEAKKQVIKLQEENVELHRQNYNLRQQVKSLLNKNRGLATALNNEQYAHAYTQGELEVAEDELDDALDALSEMEDERDTMEELYAEAMVNDSLNPNSTKDNCVKTDHHVPIMLFTF